jgi:hypothetical protein
MSHGYVIGTGYYEIKGKSFSFFNEYWLPNTLEHFSPEKIIVVNSGAELPSTHAMLEYINFPINPLHVTQLKQNTRLAGWSASFVEGALYAYFCNCDFIYKEQDCLVFGDIDERIHKMQLETNSMILTGELIGHSYRYEQSLIFLKYEYILDFISQYIGIDEYENKIRPEKKFGIINKNNPELFSFFDFGYGGMRPFNPEDECFYIQKPRWDGTKDIQTKLGCLIPADEIFVLKNKGLL